MLGKAIKLAALVCVCSAADEQYYNVLAVDGGGIRGLIPGVILRKIEQYVYTYATEKGYIAGENEDAQTVLANRKIPLNFVNKEQSAVHLSKIFDFTAGVSTGSILAAGISKPKMVFDKETKTYVSTGLPRFYSEELLNIYKKKGDQIFQRYALSGVSTFLYLWLSVTVFCAVFYYIGCRMYDSQQARQDLSLMKIAIQNARRRRDPKWVPENLENYDGFEKTQVQRALKSFTNKIADAANSLKSENPEYGRKSTHDGEESDEENNQESQIQEDNCKTKCENCCAATGKGIGIVFSKILEGVYWIMGLDDDAFAVSDTAQHETTEDQIYKQGLANAHVKHKETQEQKKANELDEKKKQVMKQLSQQIIKQHSQEKEKIENRDDIKNSLVNFMRRKSTKKMTKTDELEETLLGLGQNTPEVLDQLEKSLEERKTAYESRKHRKYYVLTVGLVIGIIVGYLVPWVLNRITHATYKRDKLEKIMEDYLGDSTFEQILTDDLMVVAYDYNSQEPRFYSKYYATGQRGIYGQKEVQLKDENGELTGKTEMRGLKLGDATGASSAAPTFFDPKTHYDGYNMKELLIDGGVIFNNPAMYAYEFARIFKKKKQIRVLSLATGEKPFTKFSNPLGITKLTWLTKLGEFMMNMETYSSHYMMLNLFREKLGKPKDYLRLQKTSKVGMDKIDPESIRQLVVDGEDLYEQNKTDVENFVAKIIEEKFGPKGVVSEEI